ncbi:FABP family protein [Cryptosporangium phraense]|uniref:FABP family protein n=1 Tax=Cryptosporangium phraense TaxID=2593070 RepID=UPI00197AB1F1|nr:FABP family protein [Cryptosporangium phraense]
MTDPAGYPYEETHDLRSGPNLHESLLGLLPYVGVWRGTGKGGYPGIEDFDYAQEVRFSHDGRPFLAYEARSWIIDAEGRPIRPGARETGWWRVQSDEDTVEVLLAHPTGFVEVYVGSIDGLKVELSTDAVVRTATAKEVSANHRLYGIVEGDLLYAVDMAAMGHDLTPHMSARLKRIAG